MKGKTQLFENTNKIDILASILKIKKMKKNKENAN